MILDFRVAYETVVGESLWLDLELETHGATSRRMLPMIWRDQNHWEVRLEGGFEGLRGGNYNYVLKREGAEEDLELCEWGGRRCLGNIAGMDGKSVFLDDWRSAGSDERVYAAKVFQAVEGGARAIGEISGNGNHEFQLYMARVPEGRVPCVLGGIDALGDWDYAKAIPLVEVAENEWRMRVDLPMDWPVEYKYGIYDSGAGTAVKLEDGASNRVLDGRDGADFVKVSDEEFRRSAEMKFRAAAVAIPVFSLRSEQGCGVGEFADLKQMADWAVGAGLKMLQILPINDTTSSRTWTDSYPYSAISAFALHPMYLRLDEMSYGLTKEAEFSAERKRLNALKQLDYEAVMTVKWRITREIFDENHDKILRDNSFLDFLKRNRDWVLDYAVFSVKRDEFGTAVFSEWGEWSNYDAQEAESLSISTEVMYFVWLQYELDRQLLDAVAHMHEVGIALKGDLPIGVDRDSVDAWVAPRLFKMETQTGAPPDAFAVKGQNWGFPTYNWEEMAKDGYAWWQARFEKLSRYFDAYRIDHILGFFRIWQVPVEHIDGIMGWFEPALPVKVEEFAQRGIEFEYDRFCKPFIREDLLKETFKEYADGVRQDFLVDWGLGCYGLRPNFTSQRKIQEFFAKLGSGDWANQDWLRDALMDLVSEVLFFEVEGSNGTEFHPRMSMADTRSFQALDEDQQERLQELYDDYFYNRQEDYWEKKAYEKLPAMRAASDMLLCGEDLGMVPACVPGVMARLGMLSLEIQRWPKISGIEFFHPAHAPYMSVVATGTHDMATLRSWWREDEKVRARFAWEMFGEGYPEQDLSGHMARRIVEQHMHSPAMWAVFPLQDLLAMHEILRSGDVESERINVPAITPFYWRWRMEMTMTELAEAEDFSRNIRQLSNESGR